MTRLVAEDALRAGREVFRRVLCGIDATPESLEAVRQAESLRDPGELLTVVTAVEVATTAEAGWAATGLTAQLEAEAALALDAAKGEAPQAAFRSVVGRADLVLREEVGRADATLLVVGTHRLRRSVGIVLGSVATMLLHEAPCSVLVARARPEGEVLPRSIVVGVDGSPESALAAGAAFHLAERLGVEVKPVAASGRKGVDTAAVEAIVAGAPVDERGPIAALTAAALPSDLLVVGSRGLGGLGALGSVSERVAHRAACSVLVVRPPANSTPPGAGERTQ